MLCRSAKKTKKTSRKAFFQTSSAPWYLLGGVLLISALCTSVFVLLGIVPKQQELQAMGTRIEQLRNQKAVLEKKPAPSKAAQKDIQALLTAVPLTDEQARLVRALKEIQTSSGASIQKLSFVEKKGQESLLGSNLPFAVENQGGAASAAKGAAGGVQLRERKAKLECSGAYAQIVDFIGKLYGMERFASVNKWILEEYKESAAPADTRVWKITLELSLFTSEGYAGKFNPVPQLPAGESQNITEPPKPGDGSSAPLQTAE